MADDHGPGIPDRDQPAAAVEVLDADPRSPEVAAAHDAYFDELSRRFERTFAPGDRASELAAYRPPGGACLLARLEGDVVGTAAMTPLLPRDADDHVALPLAEVKRMWVAPGARGRGVGRLLLDALHERALRAGVATLRLDTNEVLVAARSLYLGAGYREVPRYNDNPHATHFFELSLAQAASAPSPSSGQRGSDDGSV